MSDQIEKIEQTQQTIEQPTKGKAKRIAKKATEGTIKRQPKSKKSDVKLEPLEEDKPEVKSEPEIKKDELQEAEIIPDKEEPVVDAKEKKTKAKSKRERKLVAKNIKTDAEGKKTYEYVYEIVDENGNVISRQTVSNNQKISGKKKYEASMDDEIAESMKKWLEENKINKSALYKRINLDKHLKSMVEYIIEKNDVKLTQKQTRQIFKVKILEMTSEEKEEVEVKENKE